MRRQKLLKRRRWSDYDEHLRTMETASDDPVSTAAVEGQA
jgi:hypothetical protein